MSAFSDPRWFDRAAVVERDEVLCRAVPQPDGSLIRAAETQSGATLDVVTFRIVEGALAGHHAGLLIWPPRSASDLERTLGPLASTPDREELERRLADVTVRCRVETSPFGDLEVRKVLAVVEEHPLPEAAGPIPPTIRPDLLPAAPSEPPATRVHMIRTPEEVQEAVALLEGVAVVGFDIETTCTRLPPEQREDRGAFEPWNGTVRLVQIGIIGPDGKALALVIDCWEVDPGPVLRLLADGRLVLSHNAKFEQAWIKYRWDIEIAELLDTCAWWSVIAGHLNATGFEHGLADAKLVTLAERFLHAELDKTFQASDWAAEELSEGQLTYAGEDATILLPLAYLLEQIGDELGCAEQARMASRAGARRAAISTHYAADRHPDERADALEMIRDASSVENLGEVGAILRRLVLSAASRQTVGAAYVARRSELSA